MDMLNNLDMEDMMVDYAEMTSFNFLAAEAEILSDLKKIVETNCKDKRVEFSFEAEKDFVKRF